MWIMAYQSVHPDAPFFMRASKLVHKPRDGNQMATRSSRYSSNKKQIRYTSSKRELNWRGRVGVLEETHQLLCPSGLKLRWQLGKCINALQIQLECPDRLPSLLSCWQWM